MRVENCAGIGPRTQDGEVKWQLARRAARAGAGAVGRDVNEVGGLHRGVVERSRREEEAIGGVVAHPHADVARRALVEAERAEFLAGGNNFFAQRELGGGKHGWWHDWRITQGWGGR